MEESIFGTTTGDLKEDVHDDVCDEDQDRTQIEDLKPKEQKTGLSIKMFFFAIIVAILAFVLFQTTR